MVKNTYYIISAVRDLDTPHVDIDILLTKGRKYGLYTTFESAKEEYDKIPSKVLKNKNTGKYEVCCLHENEYWVDEKVSEHDFYILHTLKPYKIISHTPLLNDEVLNKGFKNYNIIRFKNIRRIK